jgi:hypothetical protein
MMALDFDLASVEFQLGPTVAGSYRYADEFKPYIHPLRTPRGHCVTSARPHDHKHHKGLMYGLRATGLNFWEEVATTANEAPGIERHLAFVDVVSCGSQVGFTETLRWTAQDGSLASFDELRKIACRHDPVARSFVWTWSTRLVALRAMHLIQSQWSHLLPDGSKVNYHGLGIRLRRDFGGLTGNNELRLNGERFTGRFEEQMGAQPTEVTFVGSIDETWPVERAAVTFRQDQGNALYVLSEIFPFMSLGPTNLAPLDLAPGQSIEESYTVTVSDI